MDFIQVSENEKQKVREYYNKTESQIKEDVRIIKEWIAKEPHLPQDMSGETIKITSLFKKSIAILQINVFTLIWKCFKELRAPYLW